MLDPRQVEEFLLTASQTLVGVAALLTLRFPRWLALTLLGLFAVQYAFPGQAARYLLCAIYAAIAIAALARNRRHILPTLTAPFRKTHSRAENMIVQAPSGASDADGAGVPAASPPGPRRTGTTPTLAKPAAPTSRTPQAARWRCSGVC